MTESAIYLDDSGHPSNQPRVVVAGFLASEKQWLEFDRKWKAALEKHGLGEAFHMTDFESSNRNDRAVVLENLTSIVVEHAQSSFSCLVDMAAYKKLTTFTRLKKLSELRIRLP
jgi:hypothetical protein